MTMHDMQADGPAGRGPRGDRPKRRTFSAEYKARIIAEYVAAEHGGKGEICRREGLYDTTVNRWRRQRDEAARRALAGERSVPTAEAAQDKADQKAAAARAAKLERENARLADKLARTEASLEIVGKCTRSWRASPRARIRTLRSRSPRRRARTVGAAARYQGFVPDFRAGAGDAVSPPRAPTGGRCADRATVAAQCAVGAGKGATAGRAFPDTP
ncbi:transposase [Nonomuraea sp. B12E4]|uniref:transposase n=1 Tax=Nonomuraea sp. B12E4 TaxID=3153564 RepID=UPI00325D99F0